MKDNKHVKERGYNCAISAHQIGAIIQSCFEGHDACARKPEHRMRLTDGSPYAASPVRGLCVLREAAFTLEERAIYFEALVKHTLPRHTMISEKMLKEGMLVFPKSMRLITELAKTAKARILKRSSAAAPR